MNSVHFLGSEPMFVLRSAPPIRLTPRLGLARTRGPHCATRPKSSTRSAPGCRFRRWWGSKRAPEEGGARVEGAVALQRREDAVLLRQRPEGLLPLLLVGQARRHLHLPHGDGGASRSRRRSSGWPPRPGWRCRRSRARRARPRAARKALHDVMELAAAYLRGAAAGPRRRQGARLSRRPRACRRHPAPLPHRLRAAGALRAARPSRRQGRRGRGHGRGRAPGHGRGRVGALSTASATGSCSRSPTCAGASSPSAGAP